MCYNCYMKFLSKFNKNKKVLVKLIFVLLVILFILFTFGLTKQFIKNKQLDNEISQLEEDLARLKLDKKKFLQSIDLYENEFFVEQEAREKFNMKKRGEKVVVIPVDETVLSKSKTISKQEALKNNKINNIKIWWEYFFGEV